MCSAAVSVSPMDDSGETLEVIFHVPPQILLHPDWESMAHDHALGMAHERGVIPVGPILITTELKTTTGLSLQEGMAMGVNSLAGLAATAAGLGLEIVEVKASMLIGSRL